jgi:hypothetical protein
MFKYDFDSLLKRVGEQLESSVFKKHAAGFDRRPLIDIANSFDGPKMKLLHWQRLVELGRIPHSDEGQALEAIYGIETYDVKDVEIIMISHRWLCPSRYRSKAHPDQPDNRKANAINGNGVDNGFVASWSAAR